ncbi:MULTISPECIES: J domain-containing protein [Haloarcula]|uniref:J domain-containing protein n=1 Tax=Haloarcula TaxID=2237 RepID=UPI0023ECCC76|nr:J domain-containing protein [Halomicroarcula sp. XH51]
MQYERLITGVAAVFAVLTVALTAVGLFANPAVLFLAAMFAASTYFMYYHLSGKMAASVYERVERRAATGNGRGGFGAGPREAWRPPRDGQGATARERARGARQQRRQRRTRTRQQGQRRQRVQQSRGLSTAEAYRRLGLDPSADQRAVKQAYREKVKEVHPDTEAGSESEFKRVKAAYETLTDD